MGVPIDWEPIREELGFESMQDMWETLYNNPKTNSLSKLEEFIGVSRRTILLQLRKYGIKMRPPSTHIPSKAGCFSVATKKLLERRHILKDLTPVQIIIRFGLTGHDQFYSIARRHGLEWKRQKGGRVN